MTPDEALRLIRQGEGQTVEFKETFAAANEAIESLCAFANADGGTLFFGVTDAGDLVPPSEGKRTLESFASSLSANTDPVITPRIYRVPLDDRKVFALIVARAARGQVFSALDATKSAWERPTWTCLRTKSKLAFLKGKRANAPLTALLRLTSLSLKRGPGPGRCNTDSAQNWKLRQTG